MTPFKKYWSDLTPPEKERLAEDLDTSVGYLKLIANGHREPGLELAKRMEKRTGIPRLTLKPNVLEWMRA